MMRWIGESWRRVRMLTRLGSLDRDLDEEIRFHLDRETEKNRRAGMPPDEARRRALVRFGQVDSVRDRTRDQFRPVRFDDALRDLKYILRGLRRAPGFTAAAVLTLALGIGATTAVFSVVYAVLIKPLPYPHAESLVSLEHTAPGLNLARAPEMPASLFFTYRDQNRTFQTLGLWATGTASVTGSGNPEQLKTLKVSDGTLEALGVSPMLGRWFSKEEMTPGSRDGVVLMFGYWQRTYGGDESVIGRRVIVDQRPRTIVGIMSRHFRFLDKEVDLILPDQPDRQKLHLGAFNFHGIGRLRPGATIAQANADLTRLVPAWLTGWPSPPGLDRQFFARVRLAPAVVPLAQAVVGDLSNVLWILLATIGLVLLIACANVANLLMVRSEGRRQEFAVRAALGAGWRRIARECLLESLVLGLAGGAVGLALASAALRGLLAIGPATLPRLGEIAIDPIVVAFTLTVSIASGVLFGIVPVARLGALHVAPALRDSGRVSSASRRKHRARNALVILQVALALVLLVASGLLIRTFVALRAVRPGVRAPEEVQLVTVGIPETLIADPEHVLRVQAAMRERLAAIPGVDRVSFANRAPLEDGPHEGTFIENSRGETEPAPTRQLKLMAPEFLATVGTPLVAGRDLEWSDVYEHRPVVLVSESLAREHWRTPAAALGKRLRENPTSPWREVVGVAVDVHDDGVERPAPPTVYLPVLLTNFWGERVLVWRNVTFAIRSSRTGTAAFLDEVQHAIWAVHRSVPVAQIRTLSDVYDRSMAQTSFALVMLAIAGTMALVLAVIGIYGVIAYAVAQRTREIGIRIALGAQRGALRRMFVRQGLVLASLGIGCGLAVALGVSRVMAFLLFDISALDPATYVAGSIVLVAAAALASYLPALRTTAVDPVHALRAE